MTLQEAINISTLDEELLTEGNRLKALLLAGLLGLSGLTGKAFANTNQQPQKVEQAVKKQTPLKVKKIQDGVYATVLPNGKIMAVMSGKWFIFSSDMERQEASGFEGNYNFAGNLAKDYARAATALFSAANKALQ